MFVLLAATWIGIFAMDFKRQSPERNRSRLADYLRIGLPTTCIVAVIALSPLAWSKQSAHSGIEQQAQESTVTYLQECMRDSQTDQLLPHVQTETAATAGAVSVGAASSPTLRR
jgi:hypothetical protein